MSDNIIIEAKGVKKYFSSRVSGKIKALDGVSAQIHKGEVVVAQNLFLSFGQFHFRTSVDF